MKHQYLYGVIVENTHFLMEKQYVGTYLMHQFNQSKESINNINNNNNDNNNNHTINRKQYPQQYQQQ